MKSLITKAKAERKDSRSQKFENIRKRASGREIAESNWKKNDGKVKKGEQILLPATLFSVSIYFDSLR